MTTNCKQSVNTQLSDSRTSHYHISVRLLAELSRDSTVKQKIQHLVLRVSVFSIDFSPFQPLGIQGYVIE